MGHVRAARDRRLAPAARARRHGRRGHGSRRGVRGRRERLIGDLADRPAVLAHAALRRASAGGRLARRVPAAGRARLARLGLERRARGGLSRRAAPDLSDAAYLARRSAARRGHVDARAAAHPVERLPGRGDRALRPRAGLRAIAPVARLIAIVAVGGAVPLPSSSARCS